MKNSDLAFADTTEKTTRLICYAISQHSHRRVTTVQTLAISCQSDNVYRVYITARVSGVRPVSPSCEVRSSVLRHCCISLGGSEPRPA